MELFQLTQGTQGARKNSALYGSSNNSSYTETATDENGFSYKDLLEQFQDQRNLGKKNQDQASAKSTQPTPIKETSAEEMLGNLSRMSGSFNAASRAVLGSSAKTANNADTKGLSYSQADVDDIENAILGKEIGDKDVFDKLDLNNDGKITGADLERVKDLLANDQNGDGIFNKTDKDTIFNNKNADLESLNALSSYAEKESDYNMKELKKQKDSAVGEKLIKAAKAHKEASDAQMKVDVLKNNYKIEESTKMAEYYMKMQEAKNIKDVEVRQSKLQEANKILEDIKKIQSNKTQDINNELVKQSQKMNEYITNSNEAGRVRVEYEKKLLEQNKLNQEQAAEIKKKIAEAQKRLQEKQRKVVQPTPTPIPPKPAPIPPTPTPVPPTPEPDPTPINNDEKALSFSNADLEALKMHYVEYKIIEDEETLAKYDIDGDGELRLNDLARMDEMVKLGDTDGNKVFNQQDADRLQAYIDGKRPLPDGVDKADAEKILGFWNKHVQNLEARKSEQQQINRNKQNEEFEKERTKIEEDLKNIEWYEPTPAPTPTPEPEPEPTPETEELPLLTFEPSAGDVDGDGKVDYWDLSYIKSLYLGDIKLGDISGGLKIDSNLISRMDINDDGNVDLIDFSLAVNIMQGKKEIKGIPGSSRDNPLYIVGDYVSENATGEYVNNKYVRQTSNANYDGYTCYIGHGDKIQHHNQGSDEVFISNQPHKIIVPLNFSVYDENSSTIDNNILRDFALNSNVDAEIVRTADNQFEISIPEIDETHTIETHIDNTLINFGGHHIQSYGDNSTILLNNNDNNVTLNGNKSIIIRENGSDKDYFQFTPYAKNCQIQNNIDSAFTIKLPFNVGAYSLENINGVPTIVCHSSVTVKKADGLFEAKGACISLQGKVNPEIIIKGNDGKEIQLQKLSGADKIFKPNETNLVVTNNPDNPGEWFKKYTRVANSPSETFDLQDSNGNITGQVTVSGGNEVTFTEVNGKITLVTPNLTVDGGYVTDTKGLIGLMVDGKEYVKNSDGIATYTKEGNKLKIVANGPFDIETTDAGDNIEIYAFNGNNNITFSGKDGVVNSGHGNDTIEIKGSGNVVNTGNGNDTVKISGAGSSVYLNSGENSVTINAASFVHAGTSKDKFNVNSSGATIFDFNPNEDTLNFSLSLGKLKTEVKNIAGYQSIMIKDADTERPISALVNCSDLGKIQEIINAHNQEVVVEEASQKIDELERDFAEKLGTLVQKEISSDSIKAKAELIEELKKNIPKESSIPAKDFEKLKDRIAKEAADIIASKPEITKDVLTDNASMIDFFSKIFTKNEFSEGKYTIKMDGFGEDWANVFRIEISWKDNNKEESVILGLPATEKGIKKAISNLAKSAGEVIDEKMDEATKAVISALTGVDKKIVSNVYDIGTGILEMLITGKTNDKQLANSLINITKKQLTSAIHEMIERFGNVNGVSSSWIRAQQGKVDELVKNMEVLDKMKKDLSTLSDNSESSLKKLNDKVEATKSLLKGLFEFK